MSKSKQKKWYKKLEFIWGAILIPIILTIIFSYVVPMFLEKDYCKDTYAVCLNALNESAHLKSDFSTYDESNFDILVQNKTGYTSTQIRSMAIQIEKIGKSNFDIGLANFNLENYTNALFYFNESINHGFNVGESYFFIGICFDRLGDFNSSANAYRSGLDFDSTSDGTWFNFGNALVNQEKYIEALEAYNHAIQIYPEFISAWLNRGNTLAVLGRRDESIASYNRVLELDGTFLNALISKCLLFDYSKNCSELLDVCDKAIKLGSVNSSQFVMTAAELHNKKGISLICLGQVRESLNEFNLALEMNPNHTFAVMNKQKLISEYLNSSN